MTVGTSVRRIVHRLHQSFAPARTTAAPDDTGNVQTVQVKFSATEIRDGIPVVFHFGFAACLPVGTDVAHVTISGDRSNGAILATSHQASRPKGLKPGEAMLYSTGGQQVKCLLSGMVIDGGGLPVKVIGDLHVTGDIVWHYGTGGPIAAAGHEHTGVRAGGDLSGPPASGT